MSNKDRSTKNEEVGFDLNLITDERVLNPFHEITRRTRKSLLLTTFLAFSITWAGLIPTKIEALGIELSSSDQTALHILIVIALIYFLIAFWIYSASDLMRFNIIMHAGKENIKKSFGGEILNSHTVFSEYKNYNKESKGKQTNHQLPKIPPDLIRLSALDQLIKQPLGLYKFVGRKVWFDRNVPLLSGIFSIIFILAINFMPDSSANRLIGLSLLITVLIAVFYFLTKNWRKIFESIRKKVIKIDKNFRFVRLKFIGIIIKKSKTGSWMNKWAEKRKIAIGKAGMDKILKKNKSKNRKAQTK
ncbi:MAG: hypothetical protein ACK5L8_08250 [Marinicella pacifica]